MEAIPDARLWNPGFWTDGRLVFGVTSFGAELGFVSFSGLFIPVPNRNGVSLTVCFSIGIFSDRQREGLRTIRMEVVNSKMDRIDMIRFLACSDSSPLLKEMQPP